MDYGTLSLILLTCGVLVVIVEMFIPSAGALGVVAALLLIGGVVLAFFKSLFFGLAVLTGTSFAMPVLMWMLVKVWPLTPLGKAILMNDRIDHLVPQSTTDSLIGQIGNAKTPMLPSGIVEIDGQQHDAISEGFAINPGDAIKVVSSRGNRIYVQPFEGQCDLEGNVTGNDASPLEKPIEEFGIDDDLYD